MYQITLRLYLHRSKAEGEQETVQRSEVEREQRSPLFGVGVDS